MEEIDEHAADGAVPREVVQFEAEPSSTMDEEKPPATAQRTKKGFAHSLARRTSDAWGKMKHSVMSKIKLSMKLKTLVKEDMDEFASESSAAIDAVKNGQSNVTLEAKSTHELKNINYLQQGDAEYYTEEVIKMRHSLRGDHRVVEQIIKFWRYIPKEDKDFDPTIGGLTPRQSVEVHIMKGVYEATVVLLQLVLLPVFGMKGDMNYDPEEDWLDDNKGLDIMAYPNFFDAMFELADMWCESVSAESYSALLGQLYDEFVAKQDIFLDLLRRFGYPVPPWWPGDPTPAPPSPPVKMKPTPPPFQEPRVTSARTPRPPPLELTPPHLRPIDVARPGSLHKTSIAFDKPDMARSPKWYQTYMQQVFDKHRTGADGSLEVVERGGSKSFSSGGKKNVVRMTEVLPPNQMMESDLNQPYMLVDFPPKASRDRRGSSGRGGPGPSCIFSNSPSAASVSQARRFFGGGCPLDLDDNLTVTARSESLPAISRMSQRDLTAEGSGGAPNTSRTPSSRLQHPSGSNQVTRSGRSWIWKPAELPSMRPQTASLSVKDLQRPGSSGSPLRPKPSNGGGVVNLSPSGINGIGGKSAVLLQPSSGSPTGRAGSPSKQDPVMMPQVSPSLVLATEKSSGSLPKSPSGGFKGSLKLKGSVRPQA